MVPRKRSCGTLLVSCLSLLSAGQVTTDPDQGISKSVTDWLEVFGLSSYATALAAHGYDELLIFAGLLPNELETMMRVIDVKAGHSVKFRLALEALRDEHWQHPVHRGETFHVSRNLQAVANNVAATMTKSSDDNAEQRLHKHLLSSYPSPPSIPPLHANVAMSVNFVKFLDLSLKSSMLEISAWVRLWWKDSRLKWNASQWGIDETSFIVQPSSIENSQIWVPDIEMYNSQQSIAESFALEPATVKPSGDVFWSRPGELKALCKFDGLDRFPYDELSCDLEFGPWVADEARQNLSFNLADAGINWVGKCSRENGEEKCVGSAGTAAGAATSPTSGSRYQDYAILGISAKRLTIKYASTGKTYPSLLYSVRLQRSTVFYTMKLVMPTIAMHAMSCITYFMDPSIGERLGFGITLILAVIAQDFITTEFMPVCDEELTMNRISYVCYSFVFFAIFETGVVLCIYHFKVIYYNDLPTMPLSFCCKGRAKVPVYAGLTSWKDYQKLRYKHLPHGQGEVSQDVGSSQVVPAAPDGIPAAQPRTEMRAWVSPQQEQAKAADEEDVEAQAIPRESGQDIDTELENSQPANPPNMIRQQNTREREALYMQLFCALDYDGNGRLSYAEVESFLKFLCYDGLVTPERLSTTKGDVKKTGIALDEFIHNIDKVFVRSIDATSSVLERYMDLAHVKEEKAMRRWKQIAKKIDLFCRWLVPLASLLSYLILFIIG